MNSSVTYITATNASLSTYLKNIFLYKNLIWTLAARDIKIRYSQTYLGWLWAIIQPIVGLMIFSFFFGVIVNIDTGSTPYPLIALSGMVLWNYFSYLFSQGSVALIAHQNLIQKINFPKICLIIAKSIVGMIDLFVALGLLIIGSFILNINISISLFYTPIFIALTILFGLTCAIWFSAITLKYRDLQQVIPYFTTFGIWLTPVFFPSTIIPEQFSYISYLNPMAFAIEGLRFCILGTPLPDVKYLFGVVILLVLFVSGIVYFKNIENKIPDLI
jgi:lipopolysaccharide transport system permease protein